MIIRHQDINDYTIGHTVGNIIRRMYRRYYSGNESVFKSGFKILTFNRLYEFGVDDKIRDIILKSRDIRCGYTTSSIRGYRNYFIAYK